MREQMRNIELMHDIVTESSDNESDVSEIHIRDPVCTVMAWTILKIRVVSQDLLSAIFIKAHATPGQPDVFQEFSVLRKYCYVHVAYNDARRSQYYSIERVMNDMELADEFKDFVKFKFHEGREECANKARCAMCTRAKKFISNCCQ
jgi:hypothetical protein